MKKVKLESVSADLNRKIKDPRFKTLYDLESAKVSLAQKIAELREGENLKQAELAKRMNVSRQFISQLENGGGVNLTIETLIKIAQSLNRGVKISFPKISKNQSGLVVGQELKRNLMLQNKRDGHF